MKTFILALSVFSLWVAQSLKAQACSPPLCSGLKISVKGLRNSNGIVRILLSKDKKNFEETDPEKIELSRVYFRNEKAKPEITFTFRELPSGTYAFKVIHDENSNEMLDTTLLGKPTEGIAVSNDVDIKTPNIPYEKATFTLKARTQTQKTATLQYLFTQN